MGPWRLLRKVHQQARGASEDSGWTCEAPRRHERFPELGDHEHGKRGEMKTSNYRPGVDAGWRVLFAFKRPWPRATQAGRYPKPSSIRHAQNIMKNNLAYLLSITTSTFLLAGCCTGRHTTQWEYKIAPADNYRAEAPETFLNALGKDGWILVEKDSSGSYIFKRAKH
jgi:hypothetical protein